MVMIFGKTVRVTKIKWALKAYNASSIVWGKQYIGVWIGSVRMERI